MTNLFGISNDLDQVKTMMMDPNFSAIDLKDTLDSLELAFESKADSIKYVILEKESNISALKERKKAIDERIKQEERGIKSLKDYLYNAMKFTGKTKFKTNEFNFYIKNNAEQIDKDALDETQIPYEYFNEVVVKKLDTKKLLADIKNGKEIPTVQTKITESLVIK